ncbi:SAM-dependent methyltransferase [Streptomyces bohaiensis]|uniref:SAM-dependent methyltransferase n=1 Tax=Streptomyces bohaiensis TaxID=1431344 RepID=A0ABX1CGV1_9ACTN|nr:SAM-dependent methyltransferase [Streptomyces bohaiensis]NJQ16387.1 SAM-dependent methyltransferase [Streptomyces bohaiensis]
MTEQGPTAGSIDTSRPHPARMYDYYLGGQDNYEVDRAAAEQVMAATPDVRRSARANRDFLQRVVADVVRSGTRQILDIGTGIPTSPNTHEAAQAVDPAARVVYVDNDPIVSVYAGAKLTSTPGTGFVLADLRDPAAVTGSDTLGGLIDFDEPVAVLLVSVLHFVADAEDPKGLLRSVTERLVPGSRLVISHATADFHPREVGERGAEIYARATAGLRLRTREEVVDLFEGFELEEPGVVQVSHWRPEREPNEDDGRVAVYGGLAVKR